MGKMVGVERRRRLSTACWTGTIQPATLALEWAHDPRQSARSSEFPLVSRETAHPPPSGRVRYSSNVDTQSVDDGAEMPDDIGCRPHALHLRNQPMGQTRHSTLSLCDEASPHTSPSHQGSLDGESRKGRRGLVIPAILTSPNDHAARRDSPWGSHISDPDSRFT